MVPARKFAQKRTTKIRPQNGLKSKMSIELPPCSCSITDPSLAVSSATELDIDPSDLALNMRSLDVPDMRLELIISLADRMEPPIIGKSGFVPDDVPTDALWLFERAHTILTLIGSSCNTKV